MSALLLPARPLLSDAELSFPQAENFWACCRYCDTTVRTTDHHQGWTLDRDGWVCCPDCTARALLLPGVPR